jgi:hypothetical protein
MTFGHAADDESSHESPPPGSERPDPSGAVEPGRSARRDVASATPAAARSGVWFLEPDPPDGCTICHELRLDEPQAFWEWQMLDRTVSAWRFACRHVPDLPLVIDLRSVELPRGGRGAQLPGSARRRPNRKR